jgi:hypothetical protein
MNQSKRKHESHQRPDAAASLPPRSGLPRITHRAETIPFTHSPFNHSPISVVHVPS